MFRFNRYFHSIISYHTDACSLKFTYWSTSIIKQKLKFYKQETQPIFSSGIPETCYILIKWGDKLQSLLVSFETKLNAVKAHLKTKIFDNKCKLNLTYKFTSPLNVSFFA